MKLRPTTRLKLAARAARRRRYGYAALRVLRRGLRAAVADHYVRSISDSVYVSELEEIRLTFARALRAHVQRFGFAALDDVRSEP